MKKLDKLDAQPIHKKGLRRYFSNLRSDKDFSLFLFAGLFGGIATGIFMTIFNNYLSDIFNLTADGRGLVEFPRELPGVLIVFVLAFLAFLGDIRIIFVGTLAAAAGLLGLGVLSPTFGTMLIWMMVFSMGQHIMFTITPAIGMSLSDRAEHGVRLGRISAYTITGMLIAYAIVWLGFKYLNFTYGFAFIIATVFMLFSAVFVFFMHPRKPEKRKIRFVFKKEFRLFYALSVVNGARKQIFLTFAPWVLIRMFQMDASTFAILGVVVAAVSILTRKLVGKAIDIKGERFILTLEAVILVAVCIGYAYAAELFTAGVAIVIIAGCYVLDNSMSSVEMARSTYVQKIAKDPADVTPTISTGISIDHVVAMSIPYFGGLLWAAVGYQYVFLAAAAIALINLILSRRIKV